MRRRWPAGLPTILTAWRSGRPISPRKPVPARQGSLLRSNEDISAFRWVEKETATLMTCSAPPDCAEIERRYASGIGLLANGGASRGNLLSGEADDVILTVSRMEAEKKSNPGYRAFLANGDNVTRTLVLFGWEVILEWSSALRAKRRDVQPRGHRGGIYPFMRGALCVFVRDLIVSGVLTDMMRGRPAVYATFSSYDEVAHRLTLEEIEERHPKLLPTLREHPHVGWLLVRSSKDGAVALGARGTHYLADGRIEGEDPLAPFSPTAARHLLRTDGFQHVGDIMVGSFYDPELDEGCAFEELICFHGGIGGPQTRPFILHPAHLEPPPDPIIGAASVHGILASWRQALQGDQDVPARADAERTSPGRAVEQPVGPTG